jgi:hypothetical protein
MCEAHNVAIALLSGCSTASPIKEQFTRRGLSAAHDDHSARHCAFNTSGCARRLHWQDTGSKSQRLRSAGFTCICWLLAPVIADGANHVGGLAHLRCTKRRRKGGVSHRDTTARGAR